MTDAELKAAIEEVRERARANAPQGPTGIDGVEMADLMPLVYARDAAEAKVAAIGTVNPRPPGLKNSIAQGLKRLVARALDWHVREQVEFNRAAMACVEATLEAMTDVNRSVSRLAAHQEANASRLAGAGERLDSLAGALEEESGALHSDIQALEEWRARFEDRYLNEQIRILRTVSELQAAYQHRLSLQDQSFRETVKAQHREFDRTLERGLGEIQQRLWEDLAKVRGEFERLIHTELRMLRQRRGGEAPVQASEGAAAPAQMERRQADESIDIDWMRFAEQFRGSEDRIAAQQPKYVERFKKATVGGRILDVGCGRGEFLQAAVAAGLDAYGIELNEDCVALCQGKGLDVAKADLFAHLASLEDASLGGLYCGQVVEHMRPAELARFIALAGAKLRKGALLAIETPNPACLAIFATHFYIDPTHTRPVPPVLLRFYMEEAGMGQVEVEYLEPAAESMPAVRDLPQSVQDAFFGGLDYSIFVVKL